MSEYFECLKNLLEMAEKSIDDLNNNTKGDPEYLLSKAKSLDRIRTIRASLQAIITENTHATGKSIGENTSFKDLEIMIEKLEDSFSQTIKLNVDIALGEVAKDMEWIHKTIGEIRERTNRENSPKVFDILGLCCSIKQHYPEWAKLPIPDQYFVYQIDRLKKLVSEL